MVRPFCYAILLLFSPIFAQAQTLTDTTAQLRAWFQEANRDEALSGVFAQ